MSMKVKVRKLLENSDESNIFDAVFVCNGHNFMPHIPPFDGFEQFEGRKMHSHIYRKANQFQGLLN